MELMCCFVLILSSSYRALRFAEVVTGTYNDPLLRHQFKKQNKKEMMMMMMDQTRVVLYQ